MRHSVENITEQQLTSSPAGGALVGVINGHTVFHKDGSLGGYAVGRLHQDGGIKGIVVTDGQRIEFQGNEIVMTAPASINPKKHDFDGKDLTGRQILSLINEENGGIAFADAGMSIPATIKLSGKKYNYDGKSRYDTDIVADCGCHHMARGGKIDSKKFKEAKELIKKLKPSDKVRSYEISAAKLKPQIFLQMIADQALGYTRDSDGKRSDVPHGHGPQYEQCKNKYGAKLVNAAIELYPVKKDGLYSRGGDVLASLQTAMAQQQIENALVVECKSVGNPDFDQDPTSAISLPAYYPVNTLEQASQVCRQYIQDNNLGGGNWTGGNVYDVTGKIVAHVSYNGRIWESPDWSEGVKEFTGDELTKKWYDNTVKDTSDDIAQPEAVNIEELILRRVHPDLDADAFLSYYRNMGYAVSTRIAGDGYTEIVADSKEDLSSLADYEERVLFYLHLHPESFYTIHKNDLRLLRDIKNAGLIYETNHPGKYPQIEVRLTETGKDFVLHYRFKSHNKAVGGPVEESAKPKVGNSSGYFKGLTHHYKNAFELNKAIEEFIDQLSPGEMITPEQKVFISYYSGYGGLESFGATGKGLLFEYFTPDEIVKRMWGLAYQHGYKGGKILEPSCGSGAFLKYAPAETLITGYEINAYSYKICKLLFPQADIRHASFETLFIKNNSTIRGRVDALDKYQLVIGNPPYGDFGGKYAGMGEKSYTKATNYIDYFIFRGLDLLSKGGLLIMIIGTEVANGGKPWLQKPATGAKAEIMKKSDLLDAYRLPNGVFERTDVLSDIIVLQKK